MERGCKKYLWNKDKVDDMYRKLTKISPVITHTTGPQETAKKTIYLWKDKEKTKRSKYQEKRKKEKTAHAHKHNQHFLSWYINGLSDGIDMANSNSNDGYDEFTNTHSNGSHEEETAATHAIDEKDTHNCHCGTDCTSDDSEK